MSNSNPSELEGIDEEEHYRKSIDAKEYLRELTDEELKHITPEQYIRLSEKQDEEDAARMDMDEDGAVHLWIPRSWKRCFGWEDGNGEEGPGYMVVEDDAWFGEDGERKRKHVLLFECIFMLIWGWGLLLVVVKLMDPITYAKLLCRILHLLRPTRVFYGHSNRVLTIIYKTLCKDHGTPSRDLVRRRVSRGNNSSLRSFAGNEAYDNLMGTLTNGINGSNNQDRRRMMMHMRNYQNWRKESAWVIRKNHVR
ncbi:uncharacterized protein LOC113308000 isoform X2 [Papaver somniferum]|uniref:uncharacterized protein LOC113308000 isoform X2 n=1 Tax=Papaver somniferum TaxID=3469 RepID=UPI000E6FB74B|nr:uncharacterized protein LOC113308000 isoform X2 [Papaver somniferum]